MGTFDYTDDDYPSDDGTMPNNVAELAKHVVGHRIVSVGPMNGEPADPHRWELSGTRITLDNGKAVILRNTSDCCAYTELEKIIFNLPTMDHIITNVVADKGYETWHVLADYGEVLELTVAWSAGNPFYYGYGFNIEVIQEDDGLDHD